MQAKSNLSIIVAVAPDLAIGRRGDLLYHVSADLRRFKALTTGHTIIMGRRTFESLPKGALPDRRNIVISTRAGYTAPGAEVFGSLDEALASAGDDETFIIGGASVYGAAMPLASRLYLTRFDRTEPDADTFFPEFDINAWVTVECTDPETDPRSEVKYHFETLQRKTC